MVLIHGAANIVGFASLHLHRTFQRRGEVRSADISLCLTADSTVKHSVVHNQISALTSGRMLFSNAQMPHLKH